MEHLLSWRFLRPCTLSLGLTLLAAAGPGAGAWAQSPPAGEERLAPGLYPPAPGPTAILAAPPPEPADPFFDIDWSVTLRGSYTKDDEGESYRAVLMPRVEATHEGRRSIVGLGAEAELALPVEGETHLGALRLDLNTSYALDSLTQVTAAAGLSFTRPDPSDPGVADDVATPAETTSGTVGLGIERRFGLFSAGLDASATRTLYGPTIMTDGTQTSNDDNNLWALDAGLRVGYQITPILEVFGRTSVERDIFDHSSGALGVKADATQYAISAGVAGSWGGILAAEGSVGTALRRFDAAGLDEVASTLYAARLTYTPDPTVTLSAGIGTTLTAAGIDTTGAARIETRADAELAYTVNAWLRLRASADWYVADIEGSGETETGHGLGLGADYKVGAHTQLSADYGFTHTEKSGTTPEDTHRVTVGVTVSR